MACTSCKNSPKSARERWFLKCLAGKNCKIYVVAGFEITSTLVTLFFVESFFSSISRVFLLLFFYNNFRTPPHWRRHSKLCWKQGPCLLLEDVASPQLVYIYSYLFTIFYLFVYNLFVYFFRPICYFVWDLTIWEVFKLLRLLPQEMYWDLKFLRKK